MNGVRFISLRNVIYINIIRDVSDVRVVGLDGRVMARSFGTLFGEV